MKYTWFELWEKLTKATMSKLFKSTQNNEHSEFLSIVISSMALGISEEYEPNYYKFGNDFAEELVKLPVEKDYRDAFTHNDFGVIKYLDSYIFFSVLLPSDQTIKHPFIKRFPNLYNDVILPSGGAIFFVHYSDKQQFSFFVPLREPFSEYVKKLRDRYIVSEDMKIRNSIKCFNAVLYIYSGDPDLREYKPPTKEDNIPRKERDRIISQYGNEEAILVSWGWKKPMIFHKGEWVVAGHWKRQPYGKGMALRKIIFIDEHPAKRKETLLKNPLSLYAEGFDERPDSDYDPKELALGIQVEYEHTGDYEIAKKIAKDHLDEIPNYYSLLIAMENKAKKNPSNGVMFTKKSDDTFSAFFPALNVEVIGYFQNADFPNEKALVERAEIFYIEVPKDSRGKGVGYSCMESVIKILRDNGAKRLNLYPTNQVASALNKKLEASGLITLLRKSHSGKSEYKINALKGQNPTKTFGKFSNTRPRTPDEHCSLAFLRHLQKNNYISETGVEYCAEEVDLLCYIKASRRYDAIEARAKKETRDRQKFEEEEAEREYALHYYGGYEYDGEPEDIDEDE